MKFIHCADLHIGSKINNLPIEKSKIIKEEVISSFERLCDFAVKSGVSAVIISGDMFDNDFVSLKVKNRVFEGIKSAKNVDFLYLSGNHDEETDLTNNFDLPNNFKIFNSQWNFYRYGKVVIGGVNFSKFDCEYLSNTLKLGENDINIVAMHGQVLGYNSADSLEKISLPKFRGKNIDYMALGHYHTYSEFDIDERGKAVYSGALCGRGFDEVGEKGFVLIEELNGKLSKKFIPFSERKFVECELDLSSYKNFYQIKDYIQKEIGNKINCKDICKLILKGELSEGVEIDINSLNILMENFCFYCKIVNETKIKIDLNKYLLDKTVVGEFVREVLKNDIENLTKMQVIMCGINALKGEEI